jgi:hypothetical protein
MGNFFGLYSRVLFLSISTCMSGFPHFMQG